MSHTYNSSGVIKATLGSSKPTDYVARGKKSFAPGRFLVNATTPTTGTVIGGAGTNNGILAVVIGPAPATAVRLGGKAFNTLGQQYYVTSGNVSYCKERLSYTSNGDLLVDTA